MSIARSISSACAPCSRARAASPPRSASTARPRWHSASTGRMSEADYLKKLGAAEVIDRQELSGPAKPLAKERWAGGIDPVGSTTLANVLSMTRYGGAIAACGLAGGMDLPGSVAPFILRAVSLLGIDSVMCPLPLRREAWKRLDYQLSIDILERAARMDPANARVALDLGRAYGMRYDYAAAERLLPVVWKPRILRMSPSPSRQEGS